LRGPRYFSLSLREVEWASGEAILLAYRVLNGEDSVGVFEPGEFVLFWVPGLEAIPLTPLYAGERAVVRFYVASRGDTSGRVVVQPPVHAGMIGPLGRGFRVGAGVSRAVLVAGGTGVAALSTLSMLLRELGVRVTVFYGARNRSLVPPLDSIVYSDKTVIATDDGSVGLHGTVVDAVKRYVELVADAELVAAAGPPPMLCRLGMLLESLGVDWESVAFSVESYVKCGLGFCGRCSLPCGSNHLLCREGSFVSGGLLQCWLRSVCGEYAGG